jgi:hypothetical protein
MDRRKEVMIFVLLATVFMLLSMLAIWWLQLDHGDRLPSPPEMSDQERAWIKSRHKYHGITISVIENGQHYFIRDGKRCRL